MTHRDLLKKKRGKKLTKRQENIARISAAHPEYTQKEIASKLLPQSSTRSVSEELSKPHVADRREELSNQARQLVNEDPSFKSISFKGTLEKIREGVEAEKTDKADHHARRPYVEMAANINGLLTDARKLDGVGLTFNIAILQNEVIEARQARGLDV